ncbi:helix-turn-helix domain-containing protein [Acetobacter cerevisiae]|uniref:helix-turn-helix domain-containing protein n=1 Tax=Acetobacter cerevisiae TaxID=178900 RepID=UPI00078302B5|nr:hypothetical protein AA14362_2545 [Acetobacter cerevisiae DSM 14362]
MIRLHRTSSKTAQTEAREARMASAVAMRRDGLTQQQISDELGICIETIQRYLKDHKGKSGPQPGAEPKPKPRMFRRHCLCCNTKISVESPYLRMCGPCRGNARGAML